MANRRMFSLDVVDTDKFLDMPASSQNLYFHLGMRADDDGFVSSPKKITKIVNCATDDLNVLISRGFVLSVGNGIVVITNWKQNNYLQKDRYRPTIYQDEKALLIETNGVYNLNPECIHTVSKLETQERIEKDRDSKDIPSAPDDKSPCAGSFLLNDGTSYEITENDVENFQQLYPGIDVRQEIRNITGWCLSNPKNRKTRAGARRILNGWLSRSQNSARPEKKTGAKPTGFSNFQQRDYDFDELERQLLSAQKNVRF